MTRTTLFGVALLMLGLPTMVPTVVSAEGFIDLYGGVASTQDADVSVEERSPFFAPAEVSRNVDFDTSITFGGRLGYWSESVPWLGVALDVSTFRAEGKDVDIAVFPVSALLMVRWPLLTSEEFPKGQLQPYVGVGPGLFISDFEVDFRPTVAEKVSEWIVDVDVGLDARAGLAWQIHRHFALFGEYRFTHVNLEFEEEGCLTFACAFVPLATEATKRTAETTLDTHHFLIGVSFRF